MNRHGGTENTAGRVPGTRTGAADLDYEGNVYTEKRVMWETLSPGGVQGAVAPPWKLAEIFCCIGFLYLDNYVY